LIDFGRYRHLLLVLYVAALLGATLTPVPGSVYPPSGFDKLVHVVLFAGLAFLISWNVRSENYAIGAVVSLVLTVVAAAMIEAVQGVLPFRDADGGDLLAGAVGAGLGIAMAGVLRGWMRSGEDSSIP
jgi:VanZ family protein